MKKELYRGKRVRALSGYFQGQYGTVTHLHGDPADETYSRPFNASDEEVWVLFESGEEYWVEVDEIQIVE